MTTTLNADPTAPTMQQQAGALLTQVAGYAGYRIVAIGLRHNLIQQLANSPATPHALAESLGLDPFYTQVWCQGAVACGILEHDGERVALAPYLSTLLLDDNSPAYAGALFQILSQPEFFDRFERELATGRRLWWDECSPEMLRAVSRTSTPFYIRLIPGALDQIPDVARQLADGTTVADLGSGLGRGLIRLATHYPRCRVVGVDGDATSVELAGARMTEAGVGDRVEFLCHPLENLDCDGEFGVVVTNLTMHECRDIDEVTRRVWRALEPGGWFVISDFPFPDNDATLRTVPGRVLAAVQFFEAQIDDQLLPRRVYDELLTRHGFTDLGHLDLTPVHAVTFGRRPAQRP